MNPETERPGSTPDLPNRTNRPGHVSQDARILHLLEEYGAVCATTLFELRMPRAAAVVHRLRKRGYVIVSEPCTDRDHRHQHPQIQYRFEAQPWPSST